MFIACTTGEKFTTLRPGMTKQQVVTLLGQPKGYSRTGDYETFQYPGGLISGWSWNTADFNVVLRNGLVRVMDLPTHRRGILRLWSLYRPPFIGSYPMPDQKQLDHEKFTAEKVVGV
jgi:SmpA / OmlA family